MGKGHKPGRKVTNHHKVVPAASCEIRKQLKMDYENSDPDSAKRLDIFKALDAHEKKHGCAARWISG
jgi:hypothetical protein